MIRVLLACENALALRRTLSTFQSKHNSISVEEVRAYLLQIPGIEMRESRGQITIKDCSVMPKGLCRNPRGTDKPSNQFKLGFATGAEGPGGNVVGGGTWNCFRCQSSGSWYDLKNLSNGVQFSSTTEVMSPQETKSGSGQSRVRPKLKLPNQETARRFTPTLMNESKFPEVAEIRKYLTEERKLSMDAMSKYGVGIGVYEFPDENVYVKTFCVTFPWVMTLAQLKSQDKELGTVTDLAKIDKAADESVFRRVKARAWNRKGWQKLDPAGGGWGLFGLHTVPHDAKSVVLTEGEYDAMAVWQATKMPAVSLPNGAGSLPLDVLPLLERFDRIYLWLDNDAPGQAGAEKFARKLGLGRCFIVKPLKDDVEKFGSVKDANDALRLGVDIQAMIDRASPPEHDQIVDFKSLREQVLHEIRHPDEYNGTPLQSLPILTKVMKGFRKGELGLITGATGAGKTTILSQMSLDLAQQGVNMLWGSFEVKNTRLVKKMLQQYYGQPLNKPGSNDVVDSLENVLDRFETLPMHFMTFHGGSEIERVIDAMDFAVYTYDVEHVIIDNLQFMMSRQGKKWGDRFEQQDVAIERFRRFASEKNIHITLVVHPRKEDEGIRLGLSSIFGSAKATQEADLVMILQNDGEVKYLDVRKNRYDGELGIVPLSFSQHTSAFYEDPDLMATIKQRMANSAASNKRSFGR